MKNYLFFFLLISMMVFSCKPTTDVDQVEQLKAELAVTKTALEKTKVALNELETQEDHPLVHIVYFKLKNVEDASALIAEIKKIEEIKVLKDLEVGTFKDLGDPRACLLYTSPSPRDLSTSRMPSSA